LPFIAKTTTNSTSALIRTNIMQTFVKKGNTMQKNTGIENLNGHDIKKRFDTVD
jgi:hypothetical protein